MNIDIKKLHPNAVLPFYGSEDACGADVVATSIMFETDSQICYGIGLAFEVPKGYGAFLFPRSSVRTKELDMSNCVGVIDPDYRGEVQVTYNKLFFANTVRKYAIGERVGQLIILATPRIAYNEVEVLSDTSRGTGGHGSTGL